jgi:hypothetical protein
MTRMSGLISLIAAGTAALMMTALAGTSSAAVFPSSPKLISATVNIIDQQSAIEDGEGNPIDDPYSGLPETYDDTSVNISAAFLGNILQPISPTSPTAPMANFTNPPGGELLDISIQAAGFCAALANSSPAPDFGMMARAEPFRIPLGQLRSVLGVQLFEGLTQQEGFIQAAEEAISPGTGATFESEGPNFFDGDPWANLTITPSLLLLPGTVKLDGITDLSSLLGSPKLKVDLLIAVVQLTALNTDATSAPVMPANPACITVPATVTMLPVAPTQEEQRSN